jgi:drug/metabolite transporter (DMT)-like permease
MIILNEMRDEGLSRQGRRELYMTAHISSARAWVHGIHWLRTSIFTLLALLAFASNSVICRFALGAALIDPASFTTIRLVSGASMLLLLITVMPKGHEAHEPGSWASAVALFLYAIAFSLAYISLNAGTGALLLFGAVQATMIMGGLWKGEKPGFFQWCGLSTALSGLVFLMLPGLASPSPAGAALMIVAGVSWGMYSLRGKRVKRPVAVTAGNFMRAVPLVVAANLVFIHSLAVTRHGAMLAFFSGAISSGLGYVIWYAALKDLTSTSAAIVQLLVPVIAAAGGIVLLQEQLTLRLVFSGALILGGIGMYFLLGNRYVLCNDHFVCRRTL